MNRIEKAVYYKQNGICNCSEAVIKAYSDLLNIPEDTLVKLGSGFGMGMGTLEATCGSLIGANILLGLLNDTNKKTTVLSRDLLKEFRILSKATICKELKGIDTGIVLTPCDICVKNACISLEKILKENNLLKE